MRKIVLKKIDIPTKKRLDEDIEWFCDSFGLCSGRDTHETATTILKGLLKRFHNDKGISTEFIGRELSISSPTINHHVRNLVDSGILYRERKLIYLRGHSLKNAVNEIRRDANLILDDLERIAGEIDKKVGLESRRPG